MIHQVLALQLNQIGLVPFEQFIYKTDLFVAYPHLTENPLITLTLLDHPKLVTVQQQLSLKLFQVQVKSELGLDYEKLRLVFALPEIEIELVVIFIQDFELLPLVELLIVQRGHFDLPFPLLALVHIGELDSYLQRLPRVDVDQVEQVLFDREDIEVSEGLQVEGVVTEALGEHRVNREQQARDLEVLVAQSERAVPEEQETNGHLQSHVESILPRDLFLTDFLLHSLYHFEGMDIAIAGHHNGKSQAQD